MHPVGRNGMHRYNNQDHSMLTAMLTAENILDDAGHDIWAVNVEEEYHEEKATGRHGTGRAAPVFPRPPPADRRAAGRGDRSVRRPLHFAPWQSPRRRSRSASG